MNKNRLNLTARFAVASEICRRTADDVFVSYQERGELRLENPHASIRLKVHAKQGDVWPGCKGIHGKDTILILVDFCQKSDSERPDFYVLTDSDWRKVVEDRINPLRKKGKQIELDDQNIAINWSDLNDHWKPYKGIDVRPSAIQKHFEKWEKVPDALMRSGRSR